MSLPYIEYDTLRTFIETFELKNFMIDKLDSETPTTSEIKFMILDYDIDDFLHNFNKLIDLLKLDVSYVYDEDIFVHGEKIHIEATVEEADEQHVEAVTAATNANANANPTAAKGKGLPRSNHGGGFIDNNKISRKSRKSRKYRKYSKQRKYRKYRKQRKSSKSRKQRKSRKSRKQRKSRKSRKHRKSRKSRKYRKYGGSKNDPRPHPPMPPKYKDVVNDPRTLLPRNTIMQTVSTYRRLTSLARQQQQQSAATGQSHTGERQPATGRPRVTSSPVHHRAVPKHLQSPQIQTIHQEARREAHQEARREAHQGAPPSGQQTLLYYIVPITKLFSPSIGFNRFFAIIQQELKSNAILKIRNCMLFTFNKGSTYTFLTKQISDIDTIISVYDTIGFSDTGFIEINTEKISYRKYSKNKLVLSKRGCKNTIKQNHVINSVVTFRPDFDERTIGYKTGLLHIIIQFNGQIYKINFKMDKYYELTSRNGQPRIYLNLNNNLYYELLPQLGLIIHDDPHYKPKITDYTRTGQKWFINPEHSQYDDQSYQNSDGKEFFYYNRMIRDFNFSNTYSTTSIKGSKMNIYSPSQNKLDYENNLFIRDLSEYMTDYYYPMFEYINYIPITPRIKVIKQFMDSSIRAQLLQTMGDSLNQTEQRAVWTNPIQERHVPVKHGPLRHGPVRHGPEVRHVPEVRPRPTRPTPEPEPSRSIVENGIIYIPWQGWVDVAATLDNSARIERVNYSDEESGGDWLQKASAQGGVGDGRDINMENHRRD